MSDADPTPAADLASAADELEAQHAVLAALGMSTAPWPVDLTTAPMIVDTDMGSDADDALALAAAAFTVPELALVLTGDETGPAAGGYGQRARAVGWLLQACGRGEVPVVAGAALSDVDCFVLDGSIPAQVPAADTDLMGAVRALAARSDGPLRWVGLAPMSNLARVVTEAPEIAARLHVTQMGAAINYRDPARAEHNVRLDLEAARAVVDAAGDGRLAGLELVVSDVTFTPAIEIGVGHPLYRALAGHPAPWAQVLTTSLDRWFTHPRGYAHSMQHDALTLSAALELPFVMSSPGHVELDDVGRLVDNRADEGSRRPVQVARRADYPAFMSWLERILIGDAPVASPEPLAGARTGRG